MTEGCGKDFFGQEPFSFEELSSENWRGIVDRFSYDMDPWDVDIVKLSSRFRKYLEKLERLNLEIPARMVLICALLLRMKTDLLQGEEREPEQTEVDDFEEDFEEFDEEMVEEEPLTIPDENVKPKVKKKAKRRVSLDELKDALGKAVNIQKKRRERRKTRQRNHQNQFIDLDKKDITDQLDSLMESLEEYFSQEGEEIPFERILERRDKEEKLEKFTHILHLETDEKIVCQQEEFFGDIKISPKEE